jgi:hypothetical protein
MAEVEIMKGLSHPNIIEYRGYFKDFDFGAEKKAIDYFNQDEADELQAESGTF